MFKDCGPKLTIEANLHIANVLDIILDLRNNLYQPFRKPDHHFAYISKSSSHPKIILRSIINK